ncbi:hypothetical protein ACFQ3Z_07095 [Streptomyces nogalater]
MSGAMIADRPPGAAQVLRAFPGSGRRPASSTPPSPWSGCSPR